MKKVLFFAVALGSVVALSSCKGSEAAYRKAYEAAMAQEATNVNTTTVTVPQTTDVTEPTQTTVDLTNQTQQNTAPEEGVRTIAGDVQVLNGGSLNAYSVVVGSFTLEANADGLARQLANKGYTSRIVKTNETINGRTGWYRVIADSFNDRGSADACRSRLKGDYPGAWILKR